MADLLFIAIAGVGVGVDLARLCLIALSQPLDGGNADQPHAADRPALERIIGHKLVTLRHPEAAQLAGFLRANPNRFQFIYSSFRYLSAATGHSLYGYIFRCQK
jgi:hypothetical protein